MELQRKMFRYDPKVAVHNFTIMKGVSPKKQPQRRFRLELIPKIEK